MDIEKLAAARALQRFKSNPFEAHWVLREKPTVRLVFLAQFVPNEANPEATVHGTLFYEKKTSKSSWQEISPLLLNRLKAGEGVRLDMHAQEVLELYQHLHGELGRTSGLQALLESVESLAPDESNALDELIAWALKNPRGLAGFVGQLKTLEAAALLNLNAAVQLAALEELQREMNENFGEGRKESYWQRLLATRPVLLQQLFAFPITIVKEGAYVGGKSLDNQGGQLVDFLIKNRLTNNVSLIEIKTPDAELLQSTPYRRNVFGCSAELGGAVAQVLTYKESLQRNFHALSHESGTPIEAFDPRCVIILGDARQLETKSQRRSFELFRAQLPAVRIVTFDELWHQLDSLIALLKGDE